MIFDNSFIVLLFQVIFFLILFIYYYKKNRHLGLSTALLAIYLLVTIISTALFLAPESKQFFKPIHFFPSIYLLLIFYMFSYPILRLNEKKIEVISRTNHLYIYAFSLFIIFVYLSSGVDIIVNFNKLIVNLFIDTQYAKELYDNSRSTLNEKGFAFLGVVSASLRDFPQFLLLYILTFKKKNKTIIIGLTFAVIISLLSGLVNGLRGNVIFVVLSSLFCFLIFKKFYTKKVLRTIKIISLTVLIAITIPFILLSNSRFDSGNSVYHNSDYATLMYSGQSLLYFNNYAFDNNGLRNGDRTINLFKGLLWEDTPKNQEERSRKHRKLHISDEVFSTFLGEFVFDFGPIITLLIFSLFSIFSIIKTRVKRKVSLEKIVLLYFIWNTLTFGVFLFPYSDISGNLRIVCLLLFVFLVVKKKKN